MSGVAGFLSGLATGITDRKDREFRERELSAYEQQVKNGMGAAPGVIGPTGGTGNGGARGGQTFTYDGAISDRPAFVYNEYIKAGLTPAAASGLTGNWMQESGADINPAAVGDNGNAFGGPQWNGPRRRAYMEYAAQKGVDPTDLGTQVAYTLYEGENSEKGAWDAIKAAKTPEEAALIASQKFWRPGVPHNERRQGYAKSVHAKFASAGDAPASPAAAPAQRTAPAVGVREAQAAPKWSWFKKFTGDS